MHCCAKLQVQINHGKVVCKEKGPPFNLHIYLFAKATIASRVLQPPHKFQNFIVATSTLAQVKGVAQKPF